MLEDDFTDVIRKALKGLALSPGEASSRAGLPSEAVDRLLEGGFSSESLRFLAPVLGLDAEALAHLPEYRPAVPDHHGVTRLDLPFHEGGVNAWVLQKGDAVLLFDTGLDADALASALEQRGIGMLDAVCITHDHPDHVGGLQTVLPRSCVAYAPGNVASGKVTVAKPGDIFRTGPFRIRVVDLAGHCAGALGYGVEGLDLPVCIVGDALFAGSIGGCATPAAYTTALINLRENVLSLADETLLLPGHGPATTVGREKTANPFLSSWQDGRS